MESKKTIWVFEDDPSCIFVYQEILDNHYQTRYFDRLIDFDKTLHSSNNEQIDKQVDEQVDLMIVDLRLKDGCFLDYLSSSNAPPFSIPFIIVSSIDDIDALRFCFSEGAIDYLVKPFKKNELLVKIERYFHSPPISTTTSTSLFPPLLAPTLAPGLSTTSDLLPLSNEALSELTRKEIDILNLFFTSKDRTVNRKELMEVIWKKVTVHPKTLDVHLYNLRKKILKYGMNINFHKEAHKWKLSMSVSMSMSMSMSKPTSAQTQCHDQKKP